MSQEFYRDDTLEGKIYALLAYLSILCIVPLVFKKNSPFVLAHGKQGLVLFICETAVWILSIVIPFLLAPMMCILIGLSLWGVFAAVKGRFVRLPITAAWADKICL